MKLLSEGMKQLPCKLNKLVLKLEQNGLGENLEDFQYLGVGIQQLPSSLKELELDIYEN